MSTSQLNYRADIDGLRSIAVFTVVFFHVGFAFMPGGFVGVDVFFVISGFLITGLLVKNMQSKTFNFKQFYLRRFRRLVPAYLTVMLASYILAWFILLPQDFELHSRIAWLGLVSLSNFYIADKTSGYFAADSDDILLVHTWSLAVEEQFYLLWPVTLLLLVQFFSSRPSGLRQLSYIAFVGWLLLLALSQWLIKHNEIDAYYLLPARMFELGIGAWLALALPTLKTFSVKVHTALALLGLTVILASAVMITGNSPFPGINAFWPCFGAALLIYAGTVKNQTSSFLGRPLFVWFGKISYSLYLWHWVLFAAWRYAFGEMSLTVQLGAILASVLLSWLTLKLIEEPFRFRFTMSFSKTLTTFILVPGTILVTASHYINQHDGLLFRFDQRAPALDALYSKNKLFHEQCSTQEPNCPRTILIGDSHGSALHNFVGALSEDAGTVFVNRSKGGCKLLLGMKVIRVNKAGAPVADKLHCAKHAKSAFNNIQQGDQVLLTGYWNNINSGKVFYANAETRPLSIENNYLVLNQALTTTISYIEKQGAKAMIIRDNADIGRDLMNCSLRKTVHQAKNDCLLPIDEFQQSREWLDRLFEEMQQTFPELVIIDPSPVFCHGAGCITTWQNKPLYWDGNHLNPFGASAMAELFLQQFANPLKH